MEAFQIHQDENVIARKFKAAKICNKNPNRAVLQPLNNPNTVYNLKQHVKQDESKIISAKEQLPSEVPKLYSDKLVLKSEFKPPYLQIVKLSPIETEYENEILCHLKKMEEIQIIKPTFMRKQMYLSWNMRSTLVDWLVTVAEEYKMSSKCIHLSVNYIDRFLSSLSVVREKFQLVGVSAMLIAGKYEEIYPPEINEWSFLTDGAFKTAQIIKMEKLMLKILNFDVNLPTALDFIGFFCAKHKIDVKTMFLAQYLSELMLVEGKHYVQYLPSKLAAASLVLARYNLFNKDPWNRSLEQTAGYSLRELSPVVLQQQKTLKNSPYNVNQAVQKKYASDKYEKVALLKPRKLELDDEKWD